MFDHSLSADADQLFGIYLNDHRAGGVGARAVAVRSQASNEGTEFGEFLGWFVSELDDELAQLDVLRERCGAPLDQVKMLGARIGAEAGRLKLNGRLRGYSPLSRVAEFDLLRSGVAGKIRLWQTIEALGPDHSASSAIDVDALLARAQHQAERLEELGAKAAVLAFTSDASADAATS